MDSGRQGPMLRARSCCVPARSGRLLLALLIALWGSWTATTAGAQRLAFTSYDVESGLPSTQIWALLQDSRGLLWVGTSWGLARYDSGGFAGLGISEGLPALTVRAIVEDATGQLWLGTSTGVASYDGRQIVAHRESSAPRSTVWSAVLDRHGTLWLGTQDGLYARSNGMFRRYGVEDGLPGEYVYALLPATDGALWVGTRGAGLARCMLEAEGQLGACRTWTAEEGFEPRIVRALAEGRRGRIVVGTRDGGVRIFDQGSWRTPGRDGRLAELDVYTLLARQDGSLVIGTSDDGMLHCVDVTSGRCRRVRESAGLPDDGVRQLLEDREGALWVGTEGGLARLDDIEMLGFGESDGLPDRQVDALASDPDGTLWVGTFGGLARLRLGPHGEPETRVWRREDGLPGRWVWSIVRDRRGVLWVGTDGGLCQLREDQCRNMGVEEGLPGEFVLALAVDPGGDLWVATTAGVARLDPAAEPPRVRRIFTEADGLAATRAYMLQVDGAGRLWAAHGEGLSWFDGERFRAVEPDAGLRVSTVRGLGLARDGSLLAGGLGQVARAAPGALEPRFQTWSEDAGLAGVLTLNATELDTGELVLGTNRGVLLFDPRAAGGRGRVTARIDRDAGAVGTEVTNGGAFTGTPDGRLWFGFKKGLAGFLPPATATEEPPVASIVALTTAEGRTFRLPFTAVATEPLGWLGEAAPELPPGDRSLRVEARAMTLAASRDLTFQFRLVGHESDWSPARAEPFREYMNLAPGRYVIEARAASRSDEWGPPARQPFVVVAAWWERPVARLLATLALALALAALWRTRVRALAARRRELEARIEERTDDLSRYARALAEHLHSADVANARTRQTEEARRELFARTSHELRTPLTAILGFSELLERTVGERLSEREQRYLANVRDGGEQLLRLVNNVLDQLKLEAGRMEMLIEEVDVGAVVESVVSLMEGFALHRGVRVAHRIAGTLPPARVDIARLRQVLLNLLSNAVKFSPAGDEVILAARAVAAEESPLGTASYELAVSDHGAGIAPELREAIFEPYRQVVDGVRPLAGTGLGLSIARQLVELLGGRLDVARSDSTGSTFRVVLPVDPEAVVADAEVAASVRGGGADADVRRHVLIVEPERARFNLLAYPLEREGWLVVRAADAPETARRLAELRPQIVTARFAPTRAADWEALHAVLHEVGVAGSALALLIADDDRVGIALAIDAVVPAGEAASIVQRVLPGRGARRPVLLVAARREAGARLAAQVGALGVEVFRVEGRAAVLRALAEAPADALVLDAEHLLQLAPEIGGGRARPAVAVGLPQLLLESEPPEGTTLALLAERLVEEAGEAGRALAGAVRAVRARQRPAAGPPQRIAR